MASVTIQVRVSREEHELYKKQALDKNTTVSELIRQQMKKLGSSNVDEEFYSPDEDLEIEETKQREQESKSKELRKKKMSAFIEKITSMLEELDGNDNPAKDLL
jgi:hypothetical protein